MVVQKKFIKITEERWIVILFLFIILFYLGYSLVLVHSRYLWINTLLMVVLSSYFIWVIFNPVKFRFISAFLLSAILLVSVKRPVKEILFTSDSDYPNMWVFHAIRHPIYTMETFYRKDFQLNRAIEEIQIKKIISGNIASLKISNAERDPYTNALRIARSMNCRYYGQLDDAMNLTQQQEELQKMNIDYLITWNNTQWGKLQPVYFSPEAGVNIYLLKK